VKLVISLVIVMGLISLSGCKLLQVRGEVGGVEVDAQTNENNKDNGEDFCPPGQAKKGNC
jgi:hypothetical protein